MMKKAFATLMLLVVLCCVCVFAAGCPKEKYYNATIKVGKFLVNEQGMVENRNNPLEEWIFTPDIEEMTTEWEYDGKRYFFMVVAYQMADYPNFEDKWLIVPTYFSSDTSLWSEDRKSTLKIRGGISEKGYYTFSVEPAYSPEITQFKYRHVILEITIK